MSNQVLSITYANDAEPAAGAYWLTIKDAARPDDLLTFDEAAEFVDSLFDLSPCNEDDQNGGDEPAQDESGELTPPVEPDIYKDLAREFMADSALCESRDGSYECELQVARSHQDIDYKLVLDNGEEKQRRQIREQVTRTVSVKDESSITLELPVEGTPVHQWNGAVYGRTGIITPPEVVVLGSTLNFGKRVTGSLTMRYDTVYDLVTVQVYAKNQGSMLDNPDDRDDTEPQVCRVLAFYAGTVTEHTIEPPEREEQDENEEEKLCGGGSGEHLDQGQDAPSCYEIVTKQTLCRCSGSVADENTVEVSAPCPDTIDTPGRHLLGSRTVTVGYTICPGEENQDGSVGDPDYFVDTCCEEPFYDLPPCKKITSEFKGGKGLSDEVKALYPGAVFIPVGPAGGLCGTKTVKYQVYRRNCCDYIVPMTWNEDECADIAPGVVQVNDGSGEYTWKLHGGIGFSFSSSVLQTMIITNVPYAYVYRIGDDCGSVGITVEDGCTELQRIMLSPSGYWKKITHLKDFPERPDPAGLHRCYWQPYAICKFSDGITCLWSYGLDCLGPLPWRVYKDQYMMEHAKGGCIGTYNCATCGQSIIYTDNFSGISSSAWQTCHGSGDNCKACDYKPGELYEWSCL